jgi:hypothetical protein
MAKQEVKRHHHTIMLFLGGAITYFVSFLIARLSFWSMEVVFNKFTGGYDNYYKMINASQNFTFLEQVQIGAFLMGVIATIGLLLFLVSIALDEWIFSHKFESVKEALSWGAIWTFMFYGLDSLVRDTQIAFTSQYSGVNVFDSVGPYIYLPILVFVLFGPALIYFINHHGSKK